MLDGVRHGLAARRVRPGAGEPLPRFRWWQLFGRSLRTLPLRMRTSWLDDLAG